MSRRATAGAEAVAAAERQLTQGNASQRKGAALLVGSVCAASFEQGAVFESAMPAISSCFIHVRCHVLA